MKGISKLVFILIIIFILVACGEKPDNISNDDNLSTHEIVDKENILSNISEPKQVLIKNQKNEKVMVGSIEVTITKLATYDISGVVLEKKKHNEIVGPYDVALAWGILTKDDNYKKINIWQSGNRQVTWLVKDAAWLSSVGGINNIQTKLSHNHLIPPTEEYRRLFTKIRIGDYIRVKGYLVTVRWDNAYWGPSSLVRDDTDCEIIYVEDIKWLKEK